MVFDAKYKAASPSGAYPNADHYQMLAYCTALDVQTAWLVYAGPGRARVRRIRNRKFQLWNTPSTFRKRRRTCWRQFDGLPLGLFGKPSPHLGVAPNPELGARGLNRRNSCPSTNGHAAGMGHSQFVLRMAPFVRVEGGLGHDCGRLREARRVERHLPCQASPSTDKIRALIDCADKMAAFMEAETELVRELGRATPGKQPGANISKAGGSPRRVRGGQLRTGGSETEPIMVFFRRALSSSQLRAFTQQHLRVEAPAGTPRAARPRRARTSHGPETLRKPRDS